jgi:hypothetical protein
MVDPAKHVEGRRCSILLTDGMYVRWILQSFVTRLEVSAVGFVTSYPSLWVEECHISSGSRNLSSCRTTTGLTSEGLTRADG